MTTSRAAAAGLSTADIEGIRGGLAAGRKPKVVFTAQAGQIAGQTGQVVQLTDPDQSEEWLVVRFGRDELPFSPADLTLPLRGKAAKAEGKPGAATRAAARRTGQRTGRAADPDPAAPDPAAGPVPAPRTATATTGDSAGAGGAASTGAKPAKRAAKAARAARPKPPPAMTVTLAYEAGEWTVAAYQGSKALAKPYLIRAAEALKMVSMLDVPGVHDAVEQIVNAELAEAQRRAETLRGELAEVEARLAELRDAG